MARPGPPVRTSDLKRAPVHELLTRLARELRESGKVTGRRVRILNVMGLRAQESPKRAKTAHTRLDERASNQTVREVTEWLPIHGWSTEDVWACIEQAGTRPHPAYAAGMPRLSCRFCVLASRSALVRAAQLDREGAQAKLAMERRMGHRFRQDLSMADIITAAMAATDPVPATDWAA